MKKQVEFEIFGEGQTIYFDIIRLAELESKLGMSIVRFVQGQDAGIDFCLKALQIGLKHHYRNKNIDFFAEKMGEYLSEGGKFDDILTPIIKAIMLSGIFGKEVENAVEEQFENNEDIEGKNV